MYLSVQILASLVKDELLLFTNDWKKDRHDPHIDAANSCSEEK